MSWYPDFRGEENQSLELRNLESANGASRCLLLAIYSSVVGFISYQEPRGRSSASKVEYAKRFSLKKLILSLKLYKLSKKNIFQMLRKQGICFQLSIIKARNAFSHLWQRKPEPWRSRSTEGIKVIYPQGKARSQVKCREIKSHTGTFSIREFIYSILRMFCIFTWAIHLFILYWEL